MAEATTRCGAGRHEPDAPSLRGLVIGAGAIVVMVGVAIGVAIALVRSAPSGAPASLPAATSSALQPAPAADIEAYKREKRALLQGYGWVDRAHGVVRIPIEQAMALLASRQAPGAEPR